MSSRNSTTHTHVLRFYPDSIVSFMLKCDLGKPWYDRNKVSIIALSLLKKFCKSITDSQLNMFMSDCLFQGKISTVFLASNRLLTTNCFHLLPYLHSTFFLSFKLLSSDCRLFLRIFHQCLFNQTVDVGNCNLLRPDTYITMEWDIS